MRKRSPGRAILDLRSTGFASNALEHILRNVELRPVNPAGPDADVEAQLPLVEIDAGAEAWCGTTPPPDTPVRYWRLGECSVIVTHNHGRQWHLSIAHETRHPTWEEISQARYRCLPDGLWMAMYLPPRADYVNVHAHCFQLMETPPPMEGRPDGIR